jgi:hypothetical protein
MLLQTSFLLAVIGAWLEKGHSFRPGLVGCCFRLPTSRRMRAIEEATRRDREALSEDRLPWFLEAQGPVLDPISSTPLPPIVLGPSEETKPDYDSIHGPMGKFLDRR